MALTQSQILAFNELGRKLEEAGWEPDVPYAGPFDIGVPEDIKDRIRRAISYIREYRTVLHPLICYQNEVKLEIKTAGDVIAATADTIAGSRGFEIPASTIANALVQYGLEKFCAAAP